MALSKKKKPKINYNGNIFFWWVIDEFDDLGNMLSVNIVSEDKKFLIKHFAIQRNVIDSYLLIIGEQFPGLERKTGNSVKLNCPIFTDSFVDKGVTPKTVREILHWCFVTNISSAV